MSDMPNLSELLEQRAEANGVERGRKPFGFTATEGPNKGETITLSIRDQMEMTDDDFEELRDITEDDETTPADIAIFWMGDEEWDRFVEAGGTSNKLMHMVKYFAQQESEANEAGKSVRRNRSQRRAAERKRSKQR